MILGRSLGLIVDVQVPDAEAERLAEIRELARDCRHADRAWDTCACVDRFCTRTGKIESGLDCLLCAERGDSA